MTASTVRLTTVHGTWIAIVAGQTSKSRAITGGTHIVGRATVVIIAGVIIWCKNTTKIGLAAIVGAGITIVAGQYLQPRSAGPVRADVAQGANIPIIAGLAVCFIHATTHHVAAIGRT
tara:strand:+ start:125 stop:478 length:354 start_codon:yes stop_codon:yes gene_type:complete